MENASKALMMAAGILIGILVLSMGVYLAVIFGNYAATTQAELEQSRMTAFNDKYMKYDGRADLTIQDVITVRNYALENNIDETKGNYNYLPGAGDYSALIDVYLAETKTMVKNEQIGDFILSNNANNETTSLLTTEMATGQGKTKYTCEVHVNNTTSRVYKIYFYKTP